MSSINVIKQRGAVHLITRHLIILPCDRAPTLNQIVQGAAGLPESLKLFGALWINGVLYERSLWHMVRPKFSSQYPVSIEVYLPMRGGGGGGTKSILTTVASIALLLTAAAVSGGALGPAGLGLLGPSFASGTIGASLLASTIGIAGELEVSALRSRPLEA